MTKLDQPFVYCEDVFCIYFLFTYLENIEACEEASWTQNAGAFLSAAIVGNTFHCGKYLVPVDTVFLRSSRYFGSVLTHLWTA
jgi:hypothetical protein